MEKCLSSALVCRESLPTGCLLTAFEALTGVPVLLNTSFNVRGEPIVETPQDAMDCFLTTDIDYLVLHDMLIGKGPLHRVLTPLVRVYSDVAALVRTAAGAAYRKQPGPQGAA